MMTAIFALSLVPAGAWAAAMPDWGDAENNTPGVDTSETSYKADLKRNEGIITIAGTKKNETYDVYRIFDLASFSDDDTTPGVHVEKDNGIITTNEAYSYVISETIPNPDQEQVSTTPRVPNPWWNWLKSGGAGAKYAATVPPTGIPADDDVYWYTDANKTIAAHTDQLFWIEPEKVTVGDVGDYHVVTATKNFPSSWDVADLTGDAVDNGQDAFDYEKQDYVDPTSTGSNNSTKSSIKVVQDFAQTALAWARTQSGSPATPNATPNFSETGTGADVTVDGSGNKPIGTGTDHSGDGKVPLGWYLMGTTTGTLASLDTADRQVTVYEKNQVPELEKKVLKKGSKAGGVTEEDLVKGTKEALEKKVQELQGVYNEKLAGAAANPATATEDEVAAALNALNAAKAERPVWVDDTDADIGDCVQFRTVITAHQGAKGYRLHDAMEKGLQFVNETAATPSKTITDRYTTDGTAAYASGDYTLKVYLVSKDGSKITPIPSSYDGAINWVLKTATGTDPYKTDDGCDFEIAFQDSTLVEDDDAHKVTFSYNGGNDQAPTTSTVELKDGDRIVVTYWAKLTDDAVVYGDEDAVEGETNADTKKAALDELNKVNNAVSKTTVKDNQASPQPLVDNVPDAASPAVVAQPTEQKYTETDGNNRNTNSTILVYGQRSHTEWEKAEVTTYQFEVAKTAFNKTGTDGTKEHLLAGAQFSLYKAKEVTGDANTAASDEELAEASAATHKFVPTTGKDTLANLGNGAKGYYTTSNALLFTREDTTPGDPQVTTTHSSYHYKGDVDTADTTTAFADPVTRVIESIGGEVINVHGLEEGWYMLVEDKAPTGYNKLSHPIVVYVTGDKDSDGTRPTDGTSYNQTETDKGTEDYDADEGMLDAYGMNNNSNAGATNTINSSDGAKIPWAVTLAKDPSTEANPTQYVSGGVHVLNQTGAELPSTGGVGTTIFYVAGTVLVVGAAVMLVAKRRMGSEA